MCVQKLIKRYLLNNKVFTDSLSVNLTYLAYEFLKHFFSSGFRYYKIFRLSKLRSSDTLVILGAGRTINELSVDQLDELSGYDVAGLSYSCVLPIRQTFYFYESPSTHEKETMFEHANKILPVIMGNYEKGILNKLIWKNSENKIFNTYFDLSRFVCPNVCSILTDNTGTIKKILKYCRKFGLDKYFLVQKRGSVAALVQFGLLLKYKKIVFVGVDLSNRKYFFENNEKYMHYDLKDPLSLDDTYEGDVHPTNDRATSIPIIEVLRCIFEEERNTQFYVSSKNSELIKHLPLWNWQCP